MKILFFTPLGDLLRFRQPGRLSVSDVIDSAGLPAKLADLLRQVIRRTRLWRAEKADIAAELVGHFRDGLDSGASADDLISDFGDWRQAARLIRSAKRRSRPVAWKTAAGALKLAALCLGIVFLWYVGYALLFYAGSSSPRVDYVAKVNRVAASVPESERAWPIYRAALIRLDDIPDFSDYSRTPKPGEPGWEDVQAYLAEQSEALALVREAAAKPGFGFVAGFGIAGDDRKLWPDGPIASADEDQEKTLIGLLLPPLAELRKVAQVLALDMQRAAAEGDGARAVQDCLAMLGVARHASESPFIINDLVALAIVSLAAQTTGDIIARFPEALSEDDLRDLAHGFAACDDLMQVRYEAERWTFEDIVQHIYTDDGKGDGRLTPRGMATLKSILGPRAFGEAPAVGKLTGTFLSPAVAAVMPSRREVRQEYHRIVDQFEANACRPLWESDFSLCEEQVHEWKQSVITRIRYVLPGMMLSALGKAHIHAEKVIARRDAVSVAIALELHRRRHGDWPATLDELVPHLLPAVPPDRFDGQPMRYALVDGRPVVYSVGTDRVDGGGTPPLLPSGRPNNAGACQWISMRQLEEGWSPDQKSIGDWILWPQPADPLVRYLPDSTRSY